MLLHTFVPIAPQFLCVLDDLLIFLFNCLAMAGEIGKHIGHLAVGQIKPVLDELQWPASMQVIQDGVKGNPCPRNRQTTTGTDYSWLSVFCRLHKLILQRELSKRCLHSFTPAIVTQFLTIPDPQRLWTFTRLLRLPTDSSGHHKRHGALAMGLT